MTGIPWGAPCWGAVLAVSADQVRLGSLSQLMTLFAVFLVVLLAAWLATRFLARSGRLGAGNGDLEVVDMVRVSPYQTVELIRIGGRYVAVALSKERATLLGEWDGEELHLREREAGEGAGASGRAARGFRELLERYGNCSVTRLAPAASRVRKCRGCGPGRTGMRGAQRPGRNCSVHD